MLLSSGQYSRLRTTSQLVRSLFNELAIPAFYLSVPTSPSAFLIENVLFGGSPRQDFLHSTSMSLTSINSSDDSGATLVVVATWDNNERHGLQDAI